jgi:hypothetical protein
VVLAQPHRHLHQFIYVLLPELSVVRHSPNCRIGRVTTGLSVTVNVQPKQAMLREGPDLTQELSVRARICIVRDKS